MLNQRLYKWINKIRNLSLNDHLCNKLSSLVSYFFISRFMLIYLATDTFRQLDCEGLTLLKYLSFKSYFLFFFIIFYFVSFEVNCYKILSLCDCSGIRYSLLVGSLIGVLSTSPHVIIGIFSGSGEGARFKLYF